MLGRYREPIILVLRVIHYYCYRDPRKYVEKDGAYFSLQYCCYLDRLYYYNYKTCLSRDKLTCLSRDKFCHWLNNYLHYTLLQNFFMNQDKRSPTTYLHNIFLSNFLEYNHTDLYECFVLLKKINNINNFFVHLMHLHFSFVINLRCSILLSQYSGYRGLIKKHNGSNKSTIDFFDYMISKMLWFFGIFY